MKLTSIFFACVLTSISLILLSCVNDPAIAQTGVVSSSSIEKGKYEADSIWYGIQSRFNNSIEKEKLHNANKLDDFIVHYPINWIDIYDSVVVTCYFGEDKKSVVGKNNKLNDLQKELIKSLDFSDRLELKVYFKEENIVTKKLESTHLRRSYTVTPKFPAKYEFGEDSLINYLRVNSYDKIDISKADIFKIGPDSLETPGPVSVLFVIDEQGKAQNVRIGITSNNIETDNFLTNLIQEMPLWKPAKDARGNSVKQEFSFIVTLSKFGWGC